MSKSAKELLPSLTGGQSPWYHSLAMSPPLPKEHTTSLAASDSPLEIYSTAPYREKSKRSVHLGPDLPLRWGQSESSDGEVTCASFVKGLLGPGQHLAWTRAELA